MNWMNLRKDSFAIFESIRLKAGQDIVQITQEIETPRKKLRGNIVDLVKQDLIYCEREKPWVLGKYFLSSHAEHLLDEKGIEYDVPDFN